MITWDENSWDAINKYIKHDLETVKYPNLPINATYGFMKPKLEIKRAIFNPPATIILWNDGTKSVVKCQNGEEYDAEKGFALAYLKKLLGNDNTFNKEINKWVNTDIENIKELYIKVPKAKEITFTFTTDNIKFNDLI